MILVISAVIMMLAILAVVTYTIRQKGDVKISISFRKWLEFNIEARDKPNTPNVEVVAIAGGQVAPVLLQPAIKHALPLVEEDAPSATPVGKNAASKEDTKQRKRKIGEERPVNRT